MLFGSNWLRNQPPALGHRSSGADILPIKNRKPKNDSYFVDRDCGNLRGAGFRRLDCVVELDWKSAKGEEAHAVSTAREG